MGVPLTLGEALGVAWGRLRGALGEVIFWVRVLASAGLVFRFAAAWIFSIAPFSRGGQAGDLNFALHTSARSIFPSFGCSFR